MISVIIPFHNEKENLPELVPQLHNALHALEQPFEIVLVDDGSTDGYRKTLAPLLTKKEMIFVPLNRQMGKGRALIAGIEKAAGDIIVFMDADLQDDPADLAAFYAHIQNGYDFVNGYRFNRKDNLLIKIYSTIAGWFLRTFLNSPFSDINCGFKMFRKKVLDDVVLYGNNFRFLPLAAFYAGYQVGEVKVHNRLRVHGVSKYGAGKLFAGLVDMGSAYFLYKFAERPLQFFGMIGGWFLLLGGTILTVLTYQRLFMGILLYQRPALQYATFLIILGIQIVMTGILGELIVYLHKKKMV